MKKFILALILSLGIFQLHAETQVYKTTGFAYKTLNSNGYWNDWCEWQKSDMTVTMDMDNSIVKIYSPETQTYLITKYVRNYRDSSGGQQMEFKFIDQDYDRGTMRLRVETNGNSQIYIEFADVMWVYNVVRVY